MVETIINSLPIWTAAQTRKSKGRGKNVANQRMYGIDKLRELILDLAVCGKLVPQNPNDEPASELLNRIAEEKIRLIKEGKIRQQQPLPEITKSEKPYKLPKGWEYVRFGHATFNRDADRIPLSVEERRGRKGEYDYYGASGVIDSIDDYLFDKPLLLIGEDGANLINRSTPIAFMANGKYWVNNHAHVIDGLTEGLLLYICLHINAISLEPYITGTAQPKMNQSKMNSIILDMPPPSEQSRIVDKVDELMALCDQLEQQQTDSNAAYEILVKTLLETLTNAADQNELETNWQRIADHFDTLFKTESSIDQLKQTILQLAVKGKLVPQNSNDEPASILLEEIAAEKEKLIKEGKIKKQKPLPVIIEEEKPNKLPPNWMTTRLGNLINLISGQHLKPLDYSDNKENGMIPYLTGPAEFGILSPNPTRFTKERRAIAEKGNILITCKGSGVGKLNMAEEKTAISRQLMSAQPILTDRRFLKLLLESMNNHIREKIVGIAIPGISREDITEAIIFLPPLKEQERIVVKVDELFTICDELKKHIDHAENIQVQLADAVVDQAVS